MKIAATYKAGEIFESFSETKEFKIYKISNEKIISCDVISTNGRGGNELVEFLHSLGVNLLICHGISDTGKAALEKRGIPTLTGLSGNCDAVISSLLADNGQLNRL